MSPMSAVIAMMSAAAVSPRRCKCDGVERECYRRYEENSQNGCCQLFHFLAPLISCCVLRLAPLTYQFVVRSKVQHDSGKILSPRVFWGTR